VFRLDCRKPVATNIPIVTVGRKAEDGTIAFKTIEIRSFTTIRTNSHHEHPVLYLAIIDPIYRRISVDLDADRPNFKSTMSNPKGRPKTITKKGTEMPLSAVALE
jgi:hypothetical protein